MIGIFAVQQLMGAYVFLDSLPRILGHPTKDEQGKVLSGSITPNVQTPFTLDWALPWKPKGCIDWR